MIGGWSIESPYTEDMKIHYVRRTRKEAIKAFMADFEYDWKYWYRKGFRAVHVLITVLTFDDTSRKDKVKP